jgi:hypothetical protein
MSTDTDDRVMPCIWSDDLKMTIEEEWQDYADMARAENPDLDEVELDMARQMFYAGARSAVGIATYAMYEGQSGSMTMEQVEVIQKRVYMDVYNVCRHYCEGYHRTRQ